MRKERSIVDSDTRDSIHSDCSDLIPVNEEAEYGKVYKNGKGPNTVGVATTSATSTAKTPIMPSAPLAKKTVKNIVLVLYTPRGKFVDKVAIHYKYCCKPSCSTQASKPRREGRKRGRIGL